jgi:hypothetical protein
MSSAVIALAYLAGDPRLATIGAPGLSTRSGVPADAEFLAATTTHNLKSRVVPIARDNCGWYLQIAEKVEIIIAQG